MRPNTLTFVLLLTSMLGTCDTRSLQEENEPLMTVDETGYSHLDLEALTIQLQRLPEDSLSLPELASLRNMREVEKLLRDANEAFRLIWMAEDIFLLMRDGEDNHMATIKLLLNRYQIIDPLEQNDYGSFQDTNLQRLYAILFQSGQNSSANALLAAIRLAELNVAELKEALERDVDNQDITWVYEYLRVCARNHLRVFARHLTNRGLEYTHRYLFEEDYQAIISTPLEQTGPPIPLLN